MTNAWNNFNDAEDQQSFDLIPKGTLLKVRLTIKPGGYDDINQGWTGGLATQSSTTGSVYLQAEFVVMEGQFAKRKLWTNIGLFSPKGPTWGNMGRTLIKGILNSARGILPNDNSPQAQQARCVNGFADLAGLEFIGQVGWEKDQYGDDKAIIKTIITPDHKEYAKLMGKIVVNAPPQMAPQQVQPATVAQPVTQQTAATQPQPNQSAPAGRPSWAS